MSDNQTRFVILYHSMPEGDPRQDHLDLMVEVPGSNPPVLATWAIENRNLDLDSLEDFAEPAVRLPDHRIEYLQYEGPVSDNRGSVRRVVSGTAWALSSSTDYNANGLLEFFDDEEVSKELK